MPKARPAVRCRARRTNGEPCGNYAMHGARVCHAHGGRAPAVRKAAHRRMVEATLTRDVSRLLADERARREALEPWTGELGPHVTWSSHSPAMLRRIAAEMRKAASELSALAAKQKDSLDVEPTATDSPEVEPDVGGGATCEPLAEDGARAGAESVASRSSTDPALPTCDWCEKPVAPDEAGCDYPPRHAVCLQREQRMDQDLAAARHPDTRWFATQW